MMIICPLRRSNPAMMSAIAAAWLLCSVQAQAQGDAASRNFVTRLNLSIQTAVTGAANPASAAQRLCQDLSAWALDFDSMMPVAAAGAWERMSPAQQGAYRAAFRRRVAGDCVRNAAGQLRNTIELAGVRMLAAGDRYIATRSSGDQPTKALMWRARPGKGGALRVTDVLVDGRSAVLTARDEAKTVLEQHAGDIGALIESLNR